MTNYKALLLCASIAVGVVTTTPAMARVNLDIAIGTPPPVDRVEVVPAPRAGYEWAPGYWRWDGGHHVWTRGHWMRARSGYHWAPDRWIERDGRHHYERGHWER